MPFNILSDHNAHIKKCEEYKEKGKPPKEKKKRSRHADVRCPILQPNLSNRAIQNGAIMNNMVMLT